MSIKLKNLKSIVVLVLLLAYAGYTTLTDSNNGPKNNTTSSADPAQASTIDLSKKWSQSSPAINIHHIFLGEINKRGKPTGFHSRPNGQDPKSARIKQIQSKPNKAGVYTARIEVYDQSNKQWKEKFSSFFPDQLAANEVIKAISNAYNKRDKSKSQPWSGPSGLGFPIQGYVLNDGKINTAFPVYTKD